MSVHLKNVAHHPWLILGCGYTGTELSRRLLAAGAQVTVTRRSNAAAGQSAEQLQRDVAGGSVRGAGVDLSDVSLLGSLVARDATLVMTAPPSDNSDAEAAVVRAARAAGARRVVYVSSTGVYPRAAGAWVDETVTPDPAGPRGARRYRAESLLLDTAAALKVDAVVLRAAGIYGPGRGVAARLRQGTYRLIGDAMTFVSRIHVHDLCSAIIAAAMVESLPHRVFNVADTQPSPSRTHAQMVATELGLPTPPTVDPAEVSESVRVMLGANRRIDATRLRTELGVQFRYPTVAHALRAGAV